MIENALGLYLLVFFYKKEKPKVFSVHMSESYLSKSIPYSYGSRYGTRTDSLIKAISDENKNRVEEKEYKIY